MYRTTRVKCLWTWSASAAGCEGGGSGGSVRVIVDELGTVSHAAGIAGGERRQLLTGYSPVGILSGITGWPTVSPIVDAMVVRGNGGEQAARRTSMGAGNLRSSGGGASVLSRITKLHRLGASTGAMRRAITMRLPAQRPSRS